MPSSLAETLRELQVSSGLQMAAVVTTDGLVVEAAAADDVDAESICSVAANGLLLMDALGQELGDGTAEIATLEFPGHIVVLTPLDVDNLLILLTGAGMNLGRLRIVLRRHVDTLASMVN